MRGSIWKCILGAAKILNNRLSEDSVSPERIIRTMPLALANKIAAGEVVQRPASAAKELIENALDAGAESIQVILKAAGSELIQIIDDGCGMSEADALACFDRHATSKIQAIEDLETIRTLGFRGEALASIAAVSHVELKTRRLNDDVGYHVRMEGGAVVLTEPCALPAGTSIAVRNLFFNVPARRSFLKTPATEFKHLIETFQFLALSNPEVGFSLIHDDNEVYSLPAHPGDDFYEALRSRIATLFGEQHRNKLIQVEEKTSYLSVHGFVGEPEFNRRSRGEQFLFVNGRYIKNRYLEHAVRSAYEDLMPEGAFPFFTLFMTIDPQHVDVNVHPTKAEVKFDDERGMYGFVRTIVRKGLGTSLISPQLSMDEAMFRDPQPAPIKPAAMDFSGYQRAYTGGRSDKAGGYSRPMDAGAFRRSGASLPGELSARMYEQPELSNEGFQIPSETHAETDSEAHRADIGKNESLLWQLHNKYILTQVRSGMMVFDQNAAHERILYEKALSSLESGFGLSQQLLFPHTLEFDPGEYELIKELLPDLRALGFEIEAFGGRSVIVRGVPAELRVGDERTILEEILEQFKSNREALKLKGRENLAKSMARRGAVRSGTPMDIKEMRSLIDQLFLCDKPYACPYGRPTIINISIDELDKRFGKSGSNA